MQAFAKQMCGTGWPYMRQAARRISASRHTKPARHTPSGGLEFFGGSKAHKQIPSFSAFADIFTTLLVLP